MQLRKLCSILIFASLNSAIAQRAIVFSAYGMGYQSDKGAKNSEVLTQENQPLPDHRIEHADVPIYPELARTARISGLVQVEVTVTDGQVSFTKVKSGPQILASAAVQNILTWRFYPLINGTFITKFVYQLETTEPLDPQNPKVELQLPFLVKITAVPVYLDQQRQNSN